MRLYAVTSSAVRSLGGERPEVTIQNVVILIDDDTSIEGSALEHAHQELPASEGWEDHQVMWTEIISGHMFGPHRLLWSVEDA